MREYNVREFNPQRSTAKRTGIYIAGQTSRIINHDKVLAWRIVFVSALPEILSARVTLHLSNTCINAFWPCHWWQQTQPCPRGSLSPVFRRTLTLQRCIYPLRVPSNSREHCVDYLVQEGQIRSVGRRESCHGAIYIFGSCLSIDTSTRIFSIYLRYLATPRRAVNPADVLCIYPSPLSLSPPFLQYWICVSGTVVYTQRRLYTLGLSVRFSSSYV